MVEALLEHASSATLGPVARGEVRAQKVLEACGEKAGCFMLLLAWQQIQSLKQLYTV